MARFRITRVSDHDIALKLRSLREVHGPALEPANFHAYGQPVGQVTFPEESQPVWRLLQDAAGSSIEHFNTSVNGVGLNYWRGGADAPKSAYWDDIDIAAPSGAESHISIAASIAAFFRPIEIPSSPAPEDHVIALRAMQEATFARLELLHEEVTRKSMEHRQKLDDAYLQKTADLEQRQLVIEADQSKRLSIKEEVLPNREAVLAEQQKKLDDRGNTHARREIRERMLQHVITRIESFGVLASTAQKRGPVLLGIALLGVVFAILLMFTLLELKQLDDGVRATADLVKNADGSGVIGTLDKIEEKLKASQAAATLSSGERWWLWGRLALLSFGLIGTILYYVRWQNGWAIHHSNSEFALQQFYVDVNRANWVIESCLEWRKETASEIPTTLLESITRGLFVGPSDSQKDNVVHPADELASALLGTASKLKLKAGDAELEFDKPAKIPKST